VIGAKKDDFGNVPVTLHVQNCLGLDDAWVVEVESLDFLARMFAKGVCHLLVSHSDSDRQIDVGSLHGGIGFYLGERMTGLTALSVLNLGPNIPGTPRCSSEMFDALGRNQKSRSPAAGRQFSP